MKSTELRQKYLDFFEKKGHKIIPSASLIPLETGAKQKTLFIGAGMQPLIPFLLGEKHPKGKRIVDIQKCIRTGDIDEVGDDTHLTFFEMLGNWSLGDYWKDDSIKWSFEFLTKELNIPIERLAVSCFAGDENAPKDEESASIWEGLGIKKERITFLPKEDNWWGPVGETGPCGPDTEIFYWKSNDVAVPEKFDSTDKNWVEIWNNVFMQYVKDNNGKYVLAEQKSVDTGMGFERTLAILNGYENVYETDLFLPIIKKIEELSGKKYQDYVREFRIIADHVKAFSFLISEGVIPSNTDRGYILRRLIRTTIWEGKKIGLSEESIVEVINVIIKIYPELKPESIIDIERKEVDKFSGGVFVRGIGDTTVVMSRPDFDSDTFDSYQHFATTGVPFDIQKEIAQKYGKVLDHESFDMGRAKHQDLSRTASAGMFKGGLADHEPKTIKLHTAHHLLLSALQELFGKQVKQKGSNINQERLRIDFSFDRKITEEEKKKLEEIVNEKITAGFAIIKREMPLDEAQKIGAEMEFGVKYGNTVSVYFIVPMRQRRYGIPYNLKKVFFKFIGKDIKEEIDLSRAISKEFCGGPHVQNTSELGKFKIIKEEASSQGVRRIKAILE